MSIVLVNKFIVEFEWAKWTSRMDDVSLINSGDCSLLTSESKPSVYENSKAKAFSSPEIV